MKPDVRAGAPRLTAVTAVTAVTATRARTVMPIPVAPRCRRTG